MMQPAALIAEINHALVSAFDQLNEWFAAPGPLRVYRPASGGWTIDEILEHVALTNHYLLILIEKGATKALKNLNNLDLATELANLHFERDKLNQIGQHRAFPWIRPEHMEPRGEKSPLEVAITLQQQLHQCQAVLARMPNGEGVLYHTTMTVNALGKIDVYELVYFLAKHAERHVTQIQQVAAECS
ncbi:DinB family protein [Hymenobacter negativus]|uniref:DinB family protein n=1 Tax=Hymenobacter negativus TaxID=2795026 RepID=A0ABS3QA82_9BACT|nr:DinB family protein [Hymenobacter negativus]MBO2008157.1 DinB family protein [Hymenobacter negativus]